jgi:hypothetical protein
MAILLVASAMQVAEFVHPTKRCRDRRIQSSAAPDQRVHCFMFPVARRATQGAVWVRSVITKQINQGDLHVAFSRHPSSGDQSQSFVRCGSLHARVEDDTGYLYDIVR